MAKVKNKRENHTTKRGTYGYGYGPKETEAAEGAGRSRRGADEKVSQREKITAESFLRKKEKTVAWNFLRQDVSQRRRKRTSNSPRAM